MTIPKITNALDARELVRKYNLEQEEQKVREQELILSKIAKKAARGIDSYTIEEILQDISLDQIILVYYTDPVQISSFLKTKKFEVYFQAAAEWDRYSTDIYKISW